MELKLDDYKFGVEIEFTGCTRKTAADAVAEVIHGSPRYVGGAYYEYSVNNRKYMRSS